MNYSTIHSWNNHTNNFDSSSFSAALESTAETVFESKGWTLLAILFGYGFSYLLKGVRQIGGNQYVFFLKRMFWLFVLGFINSIFFGGDILNDYALMGLILLLFYNFNTKQLFVLAVSILLLTPAFQALLANHQLLFTPKYRDAFYELYDRHTTLDSVRANLLMRYKWMLRPSYSVILHLVQLGCFLLGMALQRSNSFEVLQSKSLRSVKKTALFSFMISIAIFFFRMAVENNGWLFEDYYNLYYPQVLSIMVFSSSAVCYLYYSGYFKGVFELMKETGKMTLTNYILQNITLFILLISIRPEWSWHWYFIAGVTLYIFQMFFSRWWLRKYDFGIFEWIWRSLSYGKWIPIVKCSRKELETSNHRSN